MSECRRYRVYGKVQGVWFRESTRRKAEPLGLQGSAINLPDGSVEVTICGAESALDELALWLHKGPILARVSKVEQVDCEAAEFSGFTVA